MDGVHNDGFQPFMGVRPIFARLMHAVFRFNRPRVNWVNYIIQCQILSIAARNAEY